MDGRTLEKAVHLSTEFSSFCQENGIHIWKIWKFHNDCILPFDGLIGLSKKVRSRSTGNHLSQACIGGISIVSQHLHQRGENKKDRDDYKTFNGYRGLCNYTCLTYWFKMDTSNPSNPPIPFDIIVSLFKCKNRKLKNRTTLSSQV